MRGTKFTDYVGDESDRYKFLWLALKQIGIWGKWRAITRQKRCCKIRTWSLNPGLWNVSVITAKISCSIVRKYVWWNWLQNSETCQMCMQNVRKGYKIDFRATWYSLLPENLWAFRGVDSTLSLQHFSLCVGRPILLNPSQALIASIQMYKVSTICYHHFTLTQNY